MRLSTVGNQKLLKYTLKFLKIPTSQSRPELPVPSGAGAEQAASTRPEPGSASSRPRLWSAQLLVSKDHDRNPGKPGLHPLSGWQPRACALVLRRSKVFKEKEKKIVTQPRCSTPTACWCLLGYSP